MTPPPGAPSGLPYRTSQYEEKSIEGITELAHKIKEMEGDFQFQWSEELTLTMIHRHCRELGYRFYFMDHTLSPIITQATGDPKWGPKIDLTYFHNAIPVFVDLYEKYKRIYWKTQCRETINLMNTYLDRKSI
jgi:hypothetical protein